MLDCGKNATGPCFKQREAVAQIMLEIISKEKRECVCKSKE